MRRPRGLEFNQKSAAASPTASPVGERRKIIENNRLQPNVVNSSEPTKALPNSAKTAQAAAVSATPRVAPAAPRPTTRAAPAGLVSSAAAKPTSDPDVASINQSRRGAVTTRPAGVTRAVTRTASIPLVLAPSGRSWESMVRVGLPRLSPSALRPPPPANPGNADQPQAEPSGWYGALRRWSFAVLAFISGLWG
jgi:hypothetical protein